MRFKLAYAYSKDSNQSAHLHSLILPIDTFDPWLPIKRPSKTDQTAHACIQKVLSVGVKLNSDNVFLIFLFS